MMNFRKAALFASVPLLLLATACSDPAATRVALDGSSTITYLSTDLEMYRSFGIQSDP